MADLSCLKNEPVGQSDADIRNRSLATNEPPNKEATPQTLRKSRRKATQRNKTVDSEESEDEDFQKKEEVFKKPSARKVTRKRL